MLEELFNGVKVEINNDRTSTNRLVHLAEKADYFIFPLQVQNTKLFMQLLVDEKNNLSIGEGVCITGACIYRHYK